MSIGIQYSVAGPGGSSSVNSVVGTVFLYAQQTVQRHREQSRLRAMCAGMSAVSDHTLKDIGVDRNTLLPIARTVSSGFKSEAEPGGQNDAGA